MKTFVFLLVTLQALSPTLNAPLKDSAEVAELEDAEDAELEPPHDGVHDHEDPVRDGKSDWTFSFNPGPISISDHSFAGEFGELSVGHYANVKNIEGDQITNNVENVKNEENIKGDKITEIKENVDNVKNEENVEIKETASGLSAAGVRSSATATTTTTTAAATTITTTAAATTITTTAAATTTTITTTAAATTITTTAAATTITTTAAATTITTTAAATTATTTAAATTATTTAAATTATTTAATTTATTTAATTTATTTAAATTAATTTATTTAAATTATTTAAATTTTTAATTTIVPSCGGGATLLSTSPRLDMVVCKDTTESTCERDFESLCPAGWNLCHPKQFNNRNHGWDYNYKDDYEFGYPLGVIYCYDDGGGAGHYGIQSNPVLSTDTSLNCGWSSSRPGCELYFRLYDCDENGKSALCCAPTSTCGDGQVQQEEEDCDDGNGSNRDNCLNSCTFRIPSINGLSGC